MAREVGVARDPCAASTRTKLLRKKPRSESDLARILAGSGVAPRLPAGAPGAVVHPLPSWYPDVNPITISLPCVARLVRRGEGRGVTD